MMKEIFEYLSFDIEKILIRRNLQSISSTFNINYRVLDAGAGTKPYQKHFRHCNYDSCDHKEPFFKGIKHTYYCDLERIPIVDDYYHVVLCTQVLEHVRNPQKVLIEFNRILSKDGLLILTVPQQAGLHGEPYHFFNFTKYGIEMLLEQSEFKVVSINKLGGIFYYLGRRIKVLPQYIFFQNYKKKNYFRCLLALLSTPLCWVFGVFLYFFDWLDVEKYDTLGYFVVARKN